MADPPRHAHSVYVIELDPAVLGERRFRERNPNHVEGMPCVYVGMTGLAVEERFANHRAAPLCRGSRRLDGSFCSAGLLTTDRVADGSVLKMVNNRCGAASGVVALQRSQYGCASDYVERSRGTQAVHGSQQQRQSQRRAWQAGADARDVSHVGRRDRKSVV